MQIDKQELIDLIQSVVNATIKALETKGLLGNGDTVGDAKTGKASKSGKSASANPKKRTAYSQTEALLFNYNNFKKIIQAKEQEIEDIRKYGVLQRGSVVVQYGGNRGGKPQGIVLDEERIEKAVEEIRNSMISTVQAVELIDKCMATIRYDPYYKVLEMRYFEGRTQEDIAIEFNCSQQNISYQKARLIKELSIRIFPDRVVNEFLTL